MESLRPPAQADRAEARALTTPILVDTDVLVDHLRGRRRLGAGSYCCSVVTRAELFAGTDSEDRLALILGALEEIPVDAAIAQLAGTLRRTLSIGFPDALIAATALSRDIVLLTGNQKHFRQVAGLRLAES